MDIKIGTKLIMTISTNDIKYLNNDLLSSKDWFIEALTGKISYCKERMFREWIPILRGKNLTIPANDNDLITLILSQSDYKDRRDKEEANPDQTVKNICLDSGKLAKSTCPWSSTRIKVFPTGQAPTENCDVH